MANHVYFGVGINGNEKCLKAFKDVMKTEKSLFYTDSDGKKHYHDTVIDIDKLGFMPVGTYDEDDYLENSWEYYVNNVGAKWCHIEDLGEEYFSGYSAWSPPVELIEYLSTYLFQFDSNHTIKMSYEDEFRNFIGVAHVEGGISSVEELEWDEISEWLTTELGIEELGEDFDWSEPREELGDTPADEWLDYKVCDWQEEN